MNILYDEIGGFNMKKRKGIIDLDKLKINYYLKRAQTFSFMMFTYFIILFAMLQYFEIKPKMELLFLSIFLMIVIISLTFHNLNRAKKIICKYDPEF